MTLSIIFLSFLISLATSKDIPIVIRGSDQNSFTPELKAGDVITEEKGEYDAIIVGGGLAGLNATLYLSDKKMKVLLLEKESQFGGLAFGGSTQNGITYDRGAAYFTRAYPEEQELLKKIGLEHYEEEYKIHEPIDSYLWKGKFYPGLWENKKTMEKLPASFTVFEHELKKADEDKWIPNQPIEDSEQLELDMLSARKWVESMPEMLSKREDEESKTLYKRYLKELAAMTDVEKKVPMQPVLDLLDVYSRSALGATTESLSALAFANFYISEVEERYTSSLGTGIATKKLVKILSGRPEVTLKPGSGVGKIVQNKNGVKVIYYEDKKWKSSRAPYVIFAAQLKVAPYLIEGFENAPQAKLIPDIRYTHYSVHVLMTKGHPYRQTYDTWVRSEDYTEKDFTDVINGRWMSPDIKGYKIKPKDEQGILTIYHPITQASWNIKSFTDKEAIQIAKYALERLPVLFEPLVKAKLSDKLEIEQVETNRWPISNHVVAPGYFSKMVPILKKPFQRIHFAHSNLGTPAFEEALYRGHCAANQVLRRLLGKKFANEAWTQCDLEEN